MRQIGLPGVVVLAFPPCTPHSSFAHQKPIRMGAVWQVILVIIKRIFTFLHRSYKIPFYVVFHDVKLIVLNGIFACCGN